ncbi:hypothetical protein RJ639_044502, partial [Escallonia herrerae]
LSSNSLDLLWIHFLSRVMEKYLRKNFDVQPKNPSQEALRRWRSAVWLVKNPRRRFRMVADLAKRAEGERKRMKIQEKMRVALYVQKAALHFIDGVSRAEHKLSEEVMQAGFSIEPEELAYVVRSHNIKSCREQYGGVDGFARKVSVSLKDGVVSSDIPLRQKIFGINRFAEKPSRSFLMFVWEALQDLTLIILMVCAVVSLGVGIATDGWPKGMYDGLGIILCIFLVVFVTVISDYKQSLQFKDLDKEKKNIMVQVTGDGSRKKVSIHDLVVGDIVHLSIGDQVPADGLFMSGYSLFIDESSLSGESEPAIHNEITTWSISDGLNLFLAIAVTILVVAVPEGLPLAVTLSLAFAMKKLMDDRALVRHLSACETMGSASCICTDKTGTLTTNHMVVTKVWICGEAKVVERKRNRNVLKSLIPERVLSILLDSIFQNTNSEVVRGKDGKTNILGSPTETALLEFGLLFQGDYSAHCKESNIIKIEPFNSVKKKMSILVALPSGGVRAFCKGASETILSMCDKIVNKNGESVSLSEEQRKSITNAINGFACEALRNLCMAFKEVENTPNMDTIPDNDYTLIAVVGIKDPVRPGVREAVQTCLAAGITIWMVTGDNINTAKAIARECGILTNDGVAIEGPDFCDKSPQEMKDIIPRLQELREVVAVTGDGTNDAPALHEADIGLAMGIAGTEVAKENADVVIMDDNFTTIVKVARWGRAVYISIQKFVQFQLTVNVVALMTNFVSACASGSTPLTAIQLLWVNMIMDTLGALALATEPPNDGLMKRPPVGRNVNFITRIMWRNIIGQSIYQLAVLGVLTFDGKRLFKLNGSDSTDVLNTFIFNTFVFCQVFNEINSRDMEKINIFCGIFSTSVSIGAVSLLVGVVLKCIPVVPDKNAATIKHHDGYESIPSGPDMA